MKLPDVLPCRLESVRLRLEHGELLTWTLWAPIPGPLPFALVCASGACWSN